MLRRLFPVCAFLAAVAVTGCTSSPPPPRNAVILVIDALRADHLSSYGYARSTSPNMDRLAQAGTRFVNGISTTPWTLPSIATMMTSLYPSVHGAQQPSNVTACSMGSANCRVQSMLDASRVTMPEVLQQQGFATVALVPGRGYVSRTFGFGQGFDTFIDDRLDARFIVEGFRDWLTANGSKRFFAYLHVLEVHAPYIGPQSARYPANSPDPVQRARAQAIGEEVTRYRGFAFDQGYRGPMDGSVEAIKRLGAGQVKEITAQDLDHLVALYDQGIAYVDYWVGQLEALLKEKGLFDQTILLVTADHGEELHDHGGFDHGATYYDEMMRVPFILHVPTLSRGQVIEDQVGLIDVFPTFLDLLGAGTVSGLQGRSVRPLLEGKPLPPRELFGQAAMIPASHAIRTDEWKYIRASGRGPQLYDLKADPGEKTNLCADDPAPCEPYANRLRAVGAEMAQARKALALPTPAPAVIDEQTRERLRNLGYE